MCICKYVVYDIEIVEVLVECEEIYVECVFFDEKVVVDDVKFFEGIQDIVIYEECLVVNKEIVGVEKIKIGKEVVQDIEIVFGKVVKEQIDIDNVKYIK